MIYSLEQTMNDQKNLDALCVDRSINTAEIFSPNAYYGGDYIFKLYTGLSLDYPLKVIIPHGIDFNNDFVWEDEITAPLPAVYCYNSKILKKYKQMTNKKILLTASHFVLVTELLKQNHFDRKGTLFFPVHSTHHILVNIDYKRMAQKLLELDERFQPVTVCMYWKDYLLGRAKPFIENGIPVVSAGHIYDPNFLFRLYYLCSLHKYASGNEFGSHVFYSIKAGCSYFHLQDLPYQIFFDEDSNPKECEHAHTSEEYEQALIDMFSEPRSSPTSEQLAFVDYYLGTRYLKAPQDLKKEILGFEHLDKFSRSWYPLQTKQKFIIPPYFYRLRCRLGSKLYWAISVLR